MKERPILFSAQMVRAILDGRKTQTRRVAKLTEEGRIRIKGEDLSRDPKDPHALKDCPYGGPGNRLWVKENFGYHRDFDPKVTQLGRGLLGYAADESGCPRSLWKKVVPSIFMPRWASRITLEIVVVRVDRLQDITEEDAKAEGVSEMVDIAGVLFESTSRLGFATLWESINGPGSWTANPWVWVIEFRRV